MAQHLPASNIATSTSVSSTVLGAYLHIAWKVLLVMSIVSLSLIIYGYIRLIKGKRSIAKQDMLIHKIKVEPKKRLHIFKGYNMLISTAKRSLNTRYKQTLRVINETKFL